MGSTSLFRCQQCGYHAEVSGGEDRGIRSRTRTVFCHNCRELTDIDHESSRCLGCRSRRVTDWVADDPCPRCGGVVDDEGLISFWD